MELKIRNDRTRHGAVKCRLIVDGFFMTAEQLEELQQDINRESLALPGVSFELLPDCDD